MALSNRERVRKGLDEMKEGLIPYIEREFKSSLGENWIDDVTANDRGFRREGAGIHWDTQAVLKAMKSNWHRVFKYELGHVPLSYVGELIEVRNKWAHEKPFSSDDVYRALDTMHRLLESVSAGKAAESLATQKADLQRVVFNEQARNKGRQQQLTLEGMPKAGLTPWREIITPHRDVASGKYMQAEFAADLAQVCKGEGSDEYRDPNEFFRRTYITTGLRELLSGALERVGGAGGDPVIELQTNFGGGKTHSMLALYHLFSGVETGSLEGIESVLQDAGIDKAKKANRAVLVGTALSPGEPSVKEDGTEVRTLWGEMAWQLGEASGQGGAEAYGLVAESDRMGTSPGSDDITKLFEKYSPCLILIDEWVAYARQLVDKTDIAGGSFEAQSTFAQALTEGAKRVPQALVVASIPSSDIEIGGEAGAKALGVLKNVFTRVAKPWRPATGDEGFEIVRRRLFEPISGKDQFANRDAAIAAFSKMYRDNAGDFPSECGEGSYRDEMQASYPIHPELFRRLYDDWSTLDRFQRTRGVLRLLAKSIHRLWESQDGSLMIMPSAMPMDDAAVKSELTKYLPDVWEPIISQDVDGPNSMPLDLDQDNPTLGRYSACRRVARALYMGTAPGAVSQNPGIGDQRIKLACAQPGETVAAFGDALRRVSDRGTYIHQDGNRYWISTRPNLNRTAQDRAAQLLREPEELDAEIIARLEKDRSRGDFAGVHVCPPDSSEVPDDPTTRLVIFRPHQGHKKGQGDSKAMEAAKDYLAKRGNSPRINRNCLVFLAPDNKELQALRDATANYLAWSSILADRESLNLDAFQENQAKTKIEDFDRTVDLRIGASWIHALVPNQLDPTSDISWDHVRVTGNEPLAKRTGTKLQSEELLFPKIGGVRLRMSLDRYLWEERDHVFVRELSEWFPRYLYLPRLKHHDTLIDAVRDGASLLTCGDTFATAEGYDESQDRYKALRLGSGGPSVIDHDTVLIKPDVAQGQADKEQPSATGGGAGGGSDTGGDGGATGGRTGPGPAPTPGKKSLTTFVGSVRIKDPIRLGREAGRIADEVLTHLATLPNANVEITMEINISAPGGINDGVVRTVSENANTLGFDHATFEED